MNHQGGRRSPWRGVRRVMKLFLSRRWTGLANPVRGLRQEREGGARACRRGRCAARQAELERNGKGGRDRGPGTRPNRSMVSGSNQAMAEACIALLSRPLGSRALSTGASPRSPALIRTLVVAGLKAEPVGRLDGGPSGARALTSATSIAIHSDRKKGNRAFILRSCAAMSSFVPLSFRLGEIGSRSAKNQPRKPALAVDIGESFQ